MMSFSRTSVRNKRQRGLDAVDDELVERALEPHQAFAARLAVDDELAHERIVIRRDRVAVIDGGIDAHAEPAGRVIGQDLAGRGPERLRVLGIDAALDGMADELHVLLRELEVAAGGDADLLDHEVDVGDRLGHRMLDLDARVHFDEIELAVLVEEFDRADAEIFELAHRLRDRLADAVAAGDVERGRGAFLPDLLVAALQRAVALAEMDGAAVAVAEHLDFDVARPREIFFQIDRVVAEGGLRLGAGGGERVGQFVGRLARLSCRGRRRRPPP